MPIGTIHRLSKWRSSGSPNTTRAPTDAVTLASIFVVNTADADPLPSVRTALDDNVPGESTYRFADALIKAGKDFDLVVVPGAGHGMGGSYGERRMRDFFVRHLLGVEPVDRNGAQ